MKRRRASVPRRSHPRRAATRGMESAAEMARKATVRSKDSSKEAASVGCAKGPKADTEIHSGSDPHAGDQEATTTWWGNKRTTLSPKPLPTWGS